MGIFLADWRKEAKNKLSFMRPDLTKEQIDKYLDKVVEKKFVNPPCLLDNNYIHKTIKSNLSAIYDWIKIKKPIIGGYAVFFKNQHESINFITRMTEKFLISRKKIKSGMKEILEAMGPDSYEYKQADRLQATEKVCGNSIYGCGGAKVSFMYNLYTAASTTATAQSLISTACEAFEGFLTNNVKFYDFDEIVSYVHNIIEEKFKIPVKEVRPRSIKEVQKHLTKMCFIPRKVDQDKLFNLLRQLTDEELTRVFYKNNLYAFILSCNTVMKHLRTFMKITDSFRAPEPKFITEEMRYHIDSIWPYLSEFVHYKHPIYNRIFRLKTSKRKAVLVIDTDSNMLHIHPWIKMMHDLFSDGHMVKEEEMYASTSLIALFITRMVQDTLDQYCKNANMPKEYWKNINMKNEFLFEKLVCMEVKKNYMSTVLLREGKPMKGKLDIKGLAFVKSGMSSEIGDIMKSIIKEEIMGSKLNLSGVIRRLNDLSTMIRDSITRGETKYARPMSIKNPDAYKEPLSEMGVRAVMVHNYAIPDDPIELPEYVKVFKIKMDKLSDIECIKSINPQVYDNLKTKVFESSNAKIKKGFNACAIQQTEEVAPDWLIPLIDVETIVQDNLKSFFPVLRSLGFDIINTRSESMMFSNIIQL